MSLIVLFTALIYSQETIYYTRYWEKGGIYNKHYCYDNDAVFYLVMPGLHNASIGKSVTGVRWP